MGSGLFITGTDTGVGKTLVTCAIIRSLIARNIPVFAAKPLATGSENRPDGPMAHPDVAQIQQALGGKPVWVGYESSHPAGPSMAARWEGRSISVQEIAQNMQRALPRDHFSVIEGAGGLLCPVSRGQTLAELAQRAGFPLVIVARTALGTLNHTLLTLEAAQTRGLRVAGIVLSQTNPSSSQVDAETALELARLTDTPILQTVPFGDLSGKSLFSLPWADLGKPKAGTSRA